MRKILNTMKYGSPKAKVVVLLTLLCSLGTVGCVGLAVVMKQMLWFFGGIVCFFIMMSLFETLQIEAQDIEQKNPDMEALLSQIDQSLEAAQMAGVGEDMYPDDEESYDDLDVSDVSDSVVTEESAGWLQILKGLFARIPFPKRKDKSSAEQAGKKKHKNKHKNKQSDRQEKKKKPEEQFEDAFEELDNLDFDMEEEQEELQEEPQTFTEEVMHTYNRKRIKKTMHRYKVKRDYRLILIDRSDTLKVRQTPAYIWTKDKEFHILLIEKEPRHIAIPIYQFREITYLKKQPAYEDIDYAVFRSESLIADMFRPYLPDYTHSTVVDDQSAYKNLYGLGTDIYVTNRSAAALFDLLALEFRVDDKVTTSSKVNTYFKEAYKANILLRDNVIDANGYADKISNILNNLAHSTVSHAEFKDTLNLLIRNKLITQEFALYYMEVRDKAR
ncbi:MAG: hypothetical protein ACI4EK_02005 [Wujia sp.]